MIHRTDVLAYAYQLHSKGKRVKEDLNLHTKVAGMIRELRQIRCVLVGLSAKGKSSTISELFQYATDVSQDSSSITIDTDQSFPNNNYPFSIEE